MKIIDVFKILIGCMILLACCNCVRTQKQLYADIQGTWVLNKDQVNYPVVIFEDQAAIFKSRGDTIYTFQYQISDDILILEDRYKQEFTGTIAVLTKDTLIFSKLLELRNEQMYVRKHKTRNSLMK